MNQASLHVLGLGERTVSPVLGSRASVLTMVFGVVGCRSHSNHTSPSARTVKFPIQMSIVWRGLSAWIVYSSHTLISTPPSLVSLRWRPRRAQPEIGRAHV